MVMLSGYPTSLGLWLCAFCIATWPFAADAHERASEERPNIIVILADDLGYGDVGANGAKLIKTPNIDRLAAGGVRLTQFYASGNVCTPSRAGLLTGQYPVRTGLANRTILPEGLGGLTQDTVTLAESLEDLGYTTGLVGKWHLGNGPEHHPLKHGFQYFYGILSSNDFPKQAIYRNMRAVIDPIDPQMLSLDFTRESSKFLKKNRSRPFFLMLSSTSPHKPLISSPKFKGQSQAGAYGDVVEELDWGIGEILDTLEQLNLTNNTLVIFTSDNGPFPEGSTGGLRGGKGTGWDGGYRVPFIARWPDKIESGITSSAMAMNIDLAPTLLSLGDNVISAKAYDGRNILPALLGSNESPHEVLYFFNNDRIAALRTDRWRMILSDYPPWRDAEPIRFEGKKNLQTLVYDMHLPPEEQYDLSREFPEEKRLLNHYLEGGRIKLESFSNEPDKTQFGDSID